MKSYTLFILVLLCVVVSNTFSQSDLITEEFKLNKDGKKSGNYFIKCNDTVLVSGFYKNDQRDSTWKFYNIHGQKTIEGKYKNGKRDSEWIYYLNGKVISRIGYSNDILEGRVCSYLSNGLPYIFYHYKNGKHHGEVKIYRKNGSLKEVRYFKNGLLDSIFIVYDKKGNKILNLEYNNGRPYSLYKSVRSPDYDLYYKGDLLFGTGDLKIYIRNLQGNYCPLEFSSYRNKRLNGKYKLYKNCARAFEGYFINDYLHGRLNYYNSFGELGDHFKVDSSEKKGIDGVLPNGVLIQEPHYGSDEIQPFLILDPKFLGEPIWNVKDSIHTMNLIIKKTGSNSTRFDNFIYKELERLGLNNNGNVFVDFEVGLTGEIRSADIKSTLPQEDNYKILELFLYGIPNFEPIYDKNGFPICYRSNYVINLDE